jgi:hypothetical protein
MGFVEKKVDFENGGGVAKEGRTEAGLIWVSGGL